MDIPFFYVMFIIRRHPIIVTYNTSHAIYYNIKKTNARGHEDDYPILIALLCILCEVQKGGMLLTKTLRKQFRFSRQRKTRQLPGHFEIPVPAQVMQHT